MHNCLAVLTEGANTGTLQEGINVIMESLTNATTLVSTYPFNLYFAIGIICSGIGIFALIKHSVK